jgi:hypothetical protein
VVGHHLGRVVREVGDAVERRVGLGEVHPALRRLGRAVDAHADDERPRVAQPLGLVDDPVGSPRVRCANLSIGSVVMSTSYDSTRPSANVTVFASASTEAAGLLRTRWSLMYGTMRSNSPPVPP